ncbi:MAG: prepilin-type N-terminal cleavage/methylation domain-containing protein [Verrucomicrobiota bacterium]
MRTPRRADFFQPLEKSCCSFPTLGKTAAGFTLVELLVVVAILGVLSAILMPAMVAAQRAAHATQCSSNLKQLYLANMLYAADHGAYVAAAPDIHGANLARWHGVRSSDSEPFDGMKSPLLPYLGGGKEIRRCPALRNVETNTALDAFESGCGGYGYNAVGVGSRSYWVGYSAEGVAAGVSPGAIVHPAQTVMFADAAYPKSAGGRRYLIEYSFAEPYQHMAEKEPQLERRTDPSIHFRHNGKANVVWCDGHVSQEKLALSIKAGGFQDSSIGWLGGADNTLFDPF